MVLHMFDDRVAELGAFDFGGMFHQAGKVIRHGAGIDGAFHAFDDQVRGFGPTHVAQHHFAGENDRTGIHFIEVGVFRRGAMRRFKDGVTRDVIDIRTRSDSDSANLRGQRVRKIIPVEIHRGDHIVILRTDEHKLKRHVGNRIFQ